ncbi:unnamed protein product [Paramecium octaurelia]|uniref:Uncharacterized protein n=1 Tax=Paramecium octaurelia TaxID=43137 RepID=A0A8S1YKB0_PAROT|nr:unnamed protein product [Paramecium octaurelia]
MYYFFLFEFHTIKFKHTSINLNQEILFSLKKFKYIYQFHNTCLQKISQKFQITQGKQQKQMSIQLGQYIKQEMKKNCFKKVCPIEMLQIPVTSVLPLLEQEIDVLQQTSALKNQVLNQMTQIGLV